jgi:hypothetical protein
MITDAPAPPALVTQSDESQCKDKNRAVVAKVGQGTSDRLLHSFLLSLGTTGDDTPQSGYSQAEVG